jgi:hypothetical protein
MGSDPQGYPIMHPMVKGACFGPVDQKATILQRDQNRGERWNRVDSTLRA